MTAPELLAALEQLAPYGPEFAGFLANHGPMAAESLLELGANDAVGPWVAAYVRHLEPAPSPRPALPADGWRTALGDPARAGEWLATIRADAAEHDWRELLVHWWPRLLPGLAAAATHGVIRVAHAVRQLADAGERPSPLLVDELARGLAYWAMRYQEIPSAGAVAGDRDAVVALAGLPRLPVEGRPAGAGIAPWLDALEHVPGYVDALERWAAPPDPHVALDDVVEAAARVLAARSDAPIAFCHAVTAPSAVRLVLPHLPDELHHATVVAVWSASAGLVAAFAADPSPDEAAPAELAAGAASSGERWTLPAATAHLRHRGQVGSESARLVEQAVAHGDEHVIKLTAAALREHDRTGSPTLLAAAGRLATRLSPMTY